jgi:putative ABC transport system ATP-binding protein
MSESIDVTSDPGDTISAGANPGDVIVSLRGVVKTFGSGETLVRALDGIDLDIYRGDFAVLAGPSGSGKTCLLQQIGCLDDLDAGEVIVEGRRTAAMSVSERASLRRDRLGFVFQNYNLITVLTAYENAEYVMMLQGVPAAERRERVGALFAEVGLAGLEDRFPSQMSGGQQQRVAFVRALSPRPALILADEPTANVDSRTSDALIQVMRDLHEEHGATLVMATHDHRIMRQGSRLIWMRDGQVTYDGPPGEFEDWE